MLFFQEQAEHLLTNATITIQVTDVDDMDPEFDNNEYYLNVTEGVKNNKIQLKK